MNYYDIHQWSGKTIITDHSHMKGWYADEIQAYINDLHTATHKNGKKRLFMLFCSNNIESIISYLALLQANDAVMLINPDLNLALKKKLIYQYQPEFIIRPNNHTTFENYETIHDLFDYQVDEASKTTKHTQIHPDLAVLLSTSGTTGNPKCVRLSHMNLQANATSISRYLQLTRKERPITTLPMNYSYGLSVINSHLLVGANIALTNEPITSRSFWEFANNRQITSIAGVPFTYQMLKQLRFETICPTSLTTLTQAGGRLNPKLATHFYNLATKYNWKFFIMYGQTEATARISYLSMEDMPNKLNSIGKAIPDGKLIITPDTNELVYTGPNVMMGYASNRDELSLGNETHGVLKTGDVAAVDAEGFFYITGRIKRFIKIYGLRVNLDDIEKNLQTEFEADVFCDGVDNELILYLLASNLVDQIKAYTIEHFGINHNAIKTKIIKSIPITDNNKINYKKLEGEVLP